MAQFTGTNGADTITTSQITAGVVANPVGSLPDAAEDDVINASGGNDTIAGGGGPGGDIINAGAGADTIYAYRGDQVDAGTEDDVIRLVGPSGPVLINGSTGYDILINETGEYDLSGTTISGIEELNTRYSNVKIQASKLAEIQLISSYNTSSSITLTGGGSAAINLSDSLETFRIYGSSENDILTFDDTDLAAITFYGGDGSFSDVSADNVRGGGNDDSLYGYGGDDVLNGGGGDDRLEGGDGSDELRGGIDNDDIYAAVGDSVFGESGNDEIVNTVATGPATVDGGSGIDTLYNQGGGNTDLTGTAITGIERLDVTYGVRVTMAQLASVQTLTSRSTSGAVTLTTGGTAAVGTDRSLTSFQIYGSSAADNLSFNDNSNARIRFYGSDGSVTDVSSDQVRGGGKADSLYGYGGNDVLNGGAGDDRLQGDQGADLLIGELGADDFYVDVGDTAQGGAGNDDFIISSATGPTTIDGGDGVDLITGNVGNFNISTTTITNVERLEIQNGVSLTTTQLGQFGLITSYGNSGQVRLTAGGTATVNTGSNLDSMIIYGSSTADTITFDNTDLAKVRFYGDGGSFFDISADNITGGGRADSLYGYGGNDVLLGLAGNDIIDGGAGNDIVDGGIGTDRLLGGAGTADQVRYLTAAAGVTVSLAKTGLQQTGGAGIDRLESFESLSGSNFNDNLIGNSGSNQLAGFGGSDLLTAGAGADFFYFGVNYGSDTITDFTNGSDRLRIQGFGASYDTAAEVIAAATQVGANVVINLPNPSSATFTTITINNLSLADLDATDFNVILA